MSAVTLSRLFAALSRNWWPRSAGGWVVVALALVLGAGPVFAQDGVKIIVDTGSLTLRVVQGGDLLLSVTDIAIGRFGTDDAKMSGDNKTPLGSFAIGWITDETIYHKFLGLNYPDPNRAERAWRDGIVDERTRAAIRRAHGAGLPPPQDTVLGGYLGIHGLGRGDPEVHRRFNWTNGCVALTNKEIDQLVSLVEIGTPVEIR